MSCYLNFKSSSALCTEYTVEALLFPGTPKSYITKYNSEYNHIIHLKLSHPFPLPNDFRNRNTEKFADHNNLDYTSMIIFSTKTFPFQRNRVAKISFFFFSFLTSGYYKMDHPVPNFSLRQLYIRNMKIISRQMALRVTHEWIL